MRVFILIAALWCVRALAADPYNNTSWTPTTVITDVRLNNAETGIMAGIEAGGFRNLKVVAGDTDRITVTADVLGVTNGTTWSALTDVSVVLEPTSGVTGTGGQDATFTAATQTNYYIWIIGKPDGTTSGVVSESSTLPVISDFPGWVTYRLVSVGLNEAAGSYAWREYYQLGAHVQLFEYDNIITQVGTSTSQTTDMAPEVPTSVSTMMNLAVSVGASGSPGVNEMLVYTDRTAFAGTPLITMRGTSADSLNTVLDMTAWYPSEDGNIKWSWTLGVGSGNGKLGVVGFYIDKLVR